MKFDLYTNSGIKKAQVELSDSVVDAKYSDKVLALYVKAYLANQRQSNAHTKDRSEVSGGGKKPHAQKGTGRARAGSSRSPLWRGGGITFGPRNTANFKVRLNKKFKSAAIKAAITKLAKNQSIIVVDQTFLSGVDFKVAKFVEKKTLYGLPEKFTLAVLNASSEIQGAVKNLQNVEIVNLANLNAYDVLKSKNLVITESDIEFINQKLG